VVVDYLNGIDYAIICLYLGAIVALGLQLKRRASASLEQYLLGGRSMPWWMLGVSGVMDFWDLAGTMIIVSFLFMLGPRGLFVEFRGGAVLVLAVTMLWTGKWRRRSGCLTGAEWMLFRFGDGPAGRTAQMARALAGIVVTIGMIAYLVKGTGLFLSTFLPFSPAQCAFVLVVSATIYSMFSGFYGVVVIHFLQLGVVVAAAIVLIALGIRESVNLDSLSATAFEITGNAEWTAAAPTFHAVMPAGYKQYESLMLVAAMYLLRNVLFGMGAGDDPKYFAARSDADCAKLTLMWTTLISLRWPMMLSIAILGLGVAKQLHPDPAATHRAVELIHLHLPDAERDWATSLSRIVHYPDAQPTGLVDELQRLLGDEWQTKLLLVSRHGTIDPERIMPAVMLLSVPVGVRSLVVVSLIASAMAGFGAWVNQSAGFFVRDIYQKHVRPTAATPELLAATWLFIAAIVSGGFLFAFLAPNINDVWGWIIMGLGGGMMMSQLLPLYWWRFNGVGYSLGMAAGIFAAIGQRFLGPRLGPEWAFLNEENWLLPLLGLVGLVGAIVGTYVSAPTPAPVLWNFYKRTLPFGLWSAYAAELPMSLKRKVHAEHWRDVTALPFALAFQVMLFLTPMMAMTRNWNSAATCALIGAVAYGGLYLIWLRLIHVSDEIVAEARTLP
jgi:solute:Na+ symporter, SSS family